MKNTKIFVATMFGLLVLAGCGKEGAKKTQSNAMDSAPNPTPMVEGVNEDMVIPPPPSVPPVITEVPDQIPEISDDAESTSSDDKADDLEQK